MKIGIAATAARPHPVAVAVGAPLLRLAMAAPALHLGRWFETIPTPPPPLSFEAPQISGVPPRGRSGSAGGAAAGGEGGPSRP
ncbi:unnamed protein product [Closterium sp. Naga37s-1]|nr:unnamed protein product [Closterium sp. Naga37s-1]